MREDGPRLLTSRCVIAKVLAVRIDRGTVIKLGVPKPITKSVTEIGFRNGREGPNRSRRPFLKEAPHRLGASRRAPRLLQKARPCIAAEHH